MNTTNEELTNEIRYLQHRYGCYLKVLNVSAVSLEPLLEKDNFNLCFVIFCVFFAVLNIGANSVLIHGLRKTNKKLNFVQNLFIYLSCTDMLAGVVLMPTLIYYQLFGMTCLYMTMMMCVVAITALGDATIVLVISILRLQAIRDPLKQIIGLRKKCFTIITQVVCTMMGSLMFYLTFYVRGTIEDFQLIGYLANAMITSLTLAVLICVLATLVEIKKRKRNSSNIFDKSMLVNHRKSAGSLLIIGSLMMFFIVVQIPNFYTLHMLLRAQELLSGETFRTTKRVTDITIILNLLNTSINSIVIVGRSEKMKRFYREKFRWCYSLRSAETSLIPMG